MRRTKRRTRAERRARRGLGVMAPIDMDDILNALFDDPTIEVEPMFRFYQSADAVLNPKPAPEPARKKVENTAAGRPKVAGLLTGGQHGHDPTESDRGG